MKRLLLLCAVAFIALSGSAQTYSYLTFETTDGTKTSLSVSNLTITYSSATATVSNDDGTTTFNLADLASMYYSTSDETTGISKVTGHRSQVTSVFDLSGRERSDADLQRGIFVVKTDKTKNAQKILVK